MRELAQRSRDLPVDEGACAAIEVLDKVFARVAREAHKLVLPKDERVGEGNLHSGDAPLG